jgi:hypothetical protein
VLGSHYPAIEPLPQSLRSLPDAPRDGAEVWLLVSSPVELLTDEFVVAKWDADNERWISDTEAGKWRRYDSDARGWLSLEAPLSDPGLRKAIRHRWHGTEEELRGRLDPSGVVEPPPRRGRRPKDVP